MPTRLELMKELRQLRELDSLREQDARRYETRSSFSERGFSWPTEPLTLENLDLGRQQIQEFIESEPSRTGELSDIPANAARFIGQSVEAIPQAVGRIGKATSGAGGIPAGLRQTGVEAKGILDFLDQQLTAIHVANSPFNLTTGERTTEEERDEARSTFRDTGYLGPAAALLALKAAPTQVKGIAGKVKLAAGQAKIGVEVAIKNQTQKLKQTLPEQVIPKLPKPEVVGKTVKFAEPPDVAPDFKAGEFTSEPSPSVLKVSAKQQAIIDRAATAQKTLNVEKAVSPKLKAMAEAEGVAFEGSQPAEFVKSKVKGRPDLNISKRISFTDPQSKTSFQVSGEVTSAKIKTARDARRADFAKAENVELGAGFDIIKAARERFKRKEKPAFVKATEAAIWARHGEIGVRKYRSKSFAEDLEGRFTPEVLEDITFVTEKTHNPFIEGDTPLKTLQRVGKVKGAAKALIDMRNRRDVMRDLVNQSGYSDQVGFLENYIPHFWTARQGKVQTVSAKWARENRFSKGRTIPTIAEGKRLGLTPLTVNAAELTRLYENISIQVIENNRMISDLYNLEVPGGKFALERESRAPADYVFLDHSALQKPFRGQDAMQLVAEELGVPKLDLKGRRALPGHGRIMVHPEILPQLNAILGQPFTGKAARAFTVTNAFLKKGALAFSLFHHITLFESASAALGPFKALDPRYNKGIRKGLDLLKEPAFVEELIRNGVEVGPLSDSQVGVVKRALLSVEAKTRGVPGLGKTVKALRQANDIWDHVLWDKLHAPYKAYAYWELKHQMLKKFPKLTDKRIGVKTAESVNNAFGGQPWELQFKSPKVRQLMHWAILAPDWTISNIKIAMQLFDSGVKGKIGRAYWRRAAIVFYSVGNALNYLFSSMDGKGEFMWENEPGKKLSVRLPGKDENGRRRYIGLGKQFKEPIRWLTEPHKIGGAKLSPVVQIATEQVTGHSTTGFPQKFKDEDFFSVEGMKERAKAVAGKVIPFAFRANNFMFALPKSQGTTGFKVVQALVKALESEPKDRDSIRMWMKAARDNGYNAKKLLSYAKREVSAQRRRKLQEERKR